MPERRLAEFALLNYNLAGEILPYLPIQNNSKQWATPRSIQSKTVGGHWYKFAQNSARSSDCNALRTDDLQQS